MTLSSALRLYHQAALRARRPVELDQLSDAELAMAYLAAGRSFEEWAVAAGLELESGELSETEQIKHNRAVQPVLDAAGLTVPAVPPNPKPQTLNPGV